MGKSVKEHKMATILSRTVFYDKGNDGIFRFHDWALVNTTLGTMLEPRAVLNPIYMPGGSGVDFDDRDYSDDFQRIDAINQFSIDRPFHLVGNEDALCGGSLIGRTGR
jgi:hypothetical protein